MGLVLLALPISQLISDLSERERTEVEVIDYKPPPLIETPPPDQEDDQEDDIEDIQEDREPPTLAQLELSMNPDLSGLGNSDFTVPTIDIGGQIDEIIYELEDLTQAHRPLSRQSPTYPPELRRAGITVTVVVRFVVRADGATSTFQI